MNPTYRIKDWEKNFEKSDSKKCQRVSWVPMPNKHDGIGYRKIMRSKDGPITYGVWCLLVQVASKSPERGTLVGDDGPLTAEDLELKTDCPARHFATAFPMLCAVGWLEKFVSPEVSGSFRTAPDDFPTPPEVSGNFPTVPDGSGSFPLQTGRTVTDITNTACAGEFETWYAIYPRRASRGAAERAFKTARKIADLQTLVEGARRYAGEVRGKESQYVKLPATWLNAKCWMDETPDETRGGDDVTTEHRDPTPEECAL